jgi:hypothetical protein
VFLADKERLRAPGDAIGGDGGDNCVQTAVQELDATRGNELFQLQNDVAVSFSGRFEAIKGTRDLI